MTKTDDLQKIIAALTMARDCIDPLTVAPLTFSTIDEAISSAAALHAPIEAGNGGGGWLPIETAPKNQKVLAAYQNELGNWRIVTGCYHTQLEWSDEYGDHEQEYAPEDWYEENDSSEVIYPTSRKPTHWRPLPPAPSHEGREKA